MASSSGTWSSDSQSQSQSQSQPQPQPSEPEMAQIFADLARGEKTAQALESHLSSLEKKIDDLLASVEPPAPAHQDHTDEKRAATRVLDGPAKS